MMPIGDYINCCAPERPGGALCCHSNHSIHCFSYCYSAGEQEEGVVSINNRRKRVILVILVTDAPSSRSFADFPRPEIELRLRRTSRLLPRLAPRSTGSSAPFQTFLAHIAIALQEVVGSGEVAYGFMNSLKLKRIAAERMDYKSIAHFKAVHSGFSGSPVNKRACNAISTVVPGIVRARP